MGVVSFTSLKLYPRGRILLCILYKRMTEGTTAVVKSLNIVTVFYECFNAVIILAGSAVA
jgi:hypothetical protein